MYAETALAAVAIEAAVGYPDAVYRAIQHPVTWIGRLITWCDKNWNLAALSYDERRWRGVATLVLLVAAGLLAGWFITSVLSHVFHGAIALLLCGAAGSAMLAQRSLHKHVADVASALETDGIAAGRKAVSMIVGRDTAALDESAVSRAAIESLAENFSDGVVAPLFWMAVLGLPGAIAYKAVNTADSMIGHKSERYLAFGWASARFDDLVNLPASRLSAFWFIAAAALSPGLSAQRAIDVTLRDASYHRSPNAGWPEAAMAGALGIQLSGPRIYSGVEVAERWVGDGRNVFSSRDIRAALGPYRPPSGFAYAPPARTAPPHPP